ncbi:glycosyltransferase [Mesorhizobium sp. M1380]|uniref:glycosyltransferase n=1 Tax=Mesorhizobium sp. M1380 TaxID=2957093 RepID=UPI0033385412
MPESRQVATAPYAPPTSAFHPSAAAMDIDEVLHQSRRVIENDLHWHVLPFRPSLPTFGFYGKLFEAKGVFELIEALGTMRSQGYEFNLLMMTRWYRDENRLRSAITDADLVDQTWLLPPLPNWRIPSFIRTCNAVAYLNRGFGTPSHVPIIPDEVLSCGGCLIVSREVQATGRYQQILQDRETCLLVEDPRDKDELISVLSHIFDHPQLVAKVGQAGYLSLGQARSFEKFIEGWVHTLKQAIG